MDEHEFAGSDSGEPFDHWHGNEFHEHLPPGHEEFGDPDPVATGPIIEPGDHALVEANLIDAPGPFAEGGSARAVGGETGPGEPTELSERGASAEPEGKPETLGPVRLGDGSVPVDDHPYRLGVDPDGNPTAGTTVEGRDDLPGLAATDTTGVAEPDVGTAADADDDLELGIDADGGSVRLASAIDDVPIANGGWDAVAVAAGLAAAGVSVAAGAWLGIRHVRNAHVIVGVLDRAGADARIEHGDLGTLVSALDAGDAVVVSWEARDPAGSPRSLRMRRIDTARGTLSFDVIDGDSLERYAMSLGEFITCWADSSGQMLVTEGDRSRSFVLPVALGDAMLRVVEHNV